MLCLQGALIELRTETAAVQDLRASLEGRLKSNPEWPQQKTGKLQFHCIAFSSSTSDSQRAPLLMHSECMCMCQMAYASANAWLTFHPMSCIAPTFCCSLHIILETQSAHSTIAYRRACRPHLGAWSIAQWPCCILDAAWPQTCKISSRLCRLADPTKTSRSTAGQPGG